MANQYNNKVVLSNGTTVIDLSTDTVTDASHIMSGHRGHLADGSVVNGTGASESQVVSIEDVPNTTGTTAKITGVAAPEGTISITTNGTHDVYAYEEAIVNVTPSLQSKSATPTETAQTITPDSNYVGLSSVSVGAISSTYVGSGITRRSSSNLTASGATVTAPAGYYASQATKSVATGTAGTPTATKGTVDDASITVTPSVTNTTGYITGGTKTGTPVTVTARELVAGVEMWADDAGAWDVADAETLNIEEGVEGTPTATKSAVSNYAVTVTPSVRNTGGWIQGGTKTGTAVSVSASELVSGTVYIDDSGTWDVTTAKYASIAEGSVGTPTASKGTVSNHSVTVTPSVTSTEGYVFGGTKTGTAVSVSASELVSGTLQITQNGQADCSNYASVNVIVPSSSGGWLPPSATLVASNDIVVNLSTDTDWDSWTPSTTSHTLRSASSSTTELYYDLPSDKCAVAVNFCDSDYRYTSSLTGAGVQLHKTWYMATYVNRISTAAEDYAIVFSSSDANAVGYTSASPTTPTLVSSATSYGFGLASGATFSFGRTGYPNRIYITRPALYSRCHATYFPTTVASQINSSASTITFHQRIWAYDITDSMGYALFDYQHGAFWN